jgi:O-antigen ligase
MTTLPFSFGLALLAAGWLLPGHYLPWVSYQQQWAAAAGAALVALSAVLGAPPRSVRCPWLALVFAAFAAVPLLQLAVGQVQFHSDAVLSALYMAALALCVVTGATLTEQRGVAWTDALMATTACAAMASTALALLQWQGVGPRLYIAELLPGARPFGNLAQPNQQATLLGMGIAAFLGAYERRRLGGLATAVGIGWLGFGIVMSQSRTGWLFVAVLVVGWAALRRRAGLRLGARPVAIGVALFAAAVVAWAPLNEALMLSVPFSLAERVHGGNLRLLHWSTLIDAIAQRPWTGYGWLQVTRAQEAAALAHPASHEMLQDSHNAVIDLMVWMGVPLAALFVAAFSVWLAGRAMRCRDARSWSLLMATTAVLTHALLEYPLDYTFFLLPLGLILGAIDASTTDAAPRAWPRWTLAAPLAGMAAMLVWVGVEAVELETSVRQLRFFMMGVDLARVSTVPPPDLVLLDGPREYHRYWLTAARTGMTARQLDWMREVSTRNAHPPAMLRYALAAGLNDRPEDAARTLALLCKMHTEERCAEGRSAWAEAQRNHPQLRPIAMPSPER